METRKVSPWIALIPVLFLITTLAVSLRFLGADPHIPLFTSAIFAALIGMFVLKMTWAEIEEGIVDTIKMSMGAIIILMIIGMVIGTWMLSGIVPTMIYYGLQILSPKIFLAATLLMCSIVSLATGSSWTTAGTVGIALMGVGMGLGIPSPMIGGAIISGAYFGDKMSPLSDTTNLAPAMAGATLFEHIKHMIFTTGPSYIISIIFFLFLGMRYSGNVLDLTLINEMNGALEATFTLSPLLLLVPVIVIGIVVMKVPAIPGLFGGAILGGIAAMMVQGSAIGDVVDALHYGFAADTGVGSVDDLLSRGGLDSMMWTISLILCAMIFGGVMEKTGMLHALASEILKIAKTTGLLVVATILTAFGMNIIAGDQYLAIVIPGRMFKDAYAERNLHPKNLSRVLEDSGTLTSPLIPWNTCGAFMIATLGLAPWTYIPYSILNLTNPLVSIFYGFTGITMEKLDKTKA
ncbi:MAG: Na+/H+ antiporter NhaC [Clostridia bacterium]|nr:Na+/H+ antiporter NhaC [Clostridia bacterium]